MKKNQINEQLQDIPVETMYKYLLRDYRALQEENKMLKKKIQSLAEGIVDTNSHEFKKIVKDYAVVYHQAVRKKQQERIDELEREIEELKSRT